MRRLKTFPTQLGAAERLVSEGELGTASLIYQRIAVSRPPSTFSELAKTQLRKLQEQGRKELQAIDHQVETAMASANEHPERVADLFREYRVLTKKYAGVPVIGKEVAKHSAKQRNDPNYAFALNETEARRLLVLAQQHEAEGNLCCAHEVYAEAAKLLPSQSAPVAIGRLAALDRDPSMAMKVADCRKLQECHEKFLIANTLKETHPDEAAEQFRWIAENAPKDSQVFLASKEHLSPVR